MLAAGLLLVWPLVSVEYLANWGIIDGTFIADAERLREAGGNPGWVAEWYGGTRWDYVYPPAIRYATAWLGEWCGWSSARAYHVYTAVLYALGPVGLYVLLRLMGRGRAWAVAGALGWLVASPAYLLLPQYGVDAELGMPMRLNVLLKYGEGPHGSAVALLPLALGLTWLGLRRGGWWLGAASVGAALVVAHNFYGAVALVILAGWMVVVLGLEGPWRQMLGRSVVLGCWTWGWNAWWLTPDYVQLTAENLRLVAQPGQWGARVGLGLLMVALIWWSWRRRGRGPAASWVLGVVALMAYWVVGFGWFGWRVIGEPHRFVPELDLALVIGGVWMVSQLPAGWAVGAVLALVAAREGYLGQAWTVIRADAQWQQRPEYCVGQWLDENYPGARVQLANSVRLWTNVWWRVPQVSGGSDQGVLNGQTMLAQWQILKDEEGSRAVDWLKAMGAHLVVVQEAGSRVVYQDYVRPEVFAGRLKKVWEDGAGNVIYETGRRWRVPARVVRAADLDAVREIPVSHYNEAELRRYVQAIEEGPEREVQLQRESPREMWVRARVEAGEVLVVQESYDAQWRATAEGRPVQVERDAAGWMVLRGLAGDVELKLEWEFPREKTVGGGLTGLTLGMVLLVGLRKIKI